jgi:hypothetical protein
VAVPVKLIVVLLFALIKQLISLQVDPDEPVTARQKSLFVSNFMPEIITVPAPVKVHLPRIMTLGVKASQSKEQRLTPATKAGFSVYVPGRMKIVCPETEAVKAAAIVLKSPLPEGSTILEFAVA